MGMEGAVGLSIVLALAMLAGVYSASQTDCNTQLAALAPCLPFVSDGQPNNGDKTPCCTALSSVHKSSPECLCKLIASNAPIPGVNLTRAEQLPALCSITDADPSKCKDIVSGGPTSSPTPAGPGGIPNTNGTGTPKPNAASTILPSPLFLLGLVTGLELLMSYSLKF